MKDKRILSGQTAYAFTEHNDGIEMTDCQGLTPCAEDIMELCDGLMEYAYKHKVETVKKESKDGYVYLLECGGKYKIGFYKDDLRRFDQLEDDDMSPFRMRIIEKSK